MTLEQDILATSKLTPQQLAKLCNDTFDTVSGRKLLTLLCSVRHPLSHLEGMTPHQHGNCEVVALLWRYGSQQPTLPDEAKPKAKTAT
jgi:hypothetical protein